ncbi:MAG: hypothetical protein EA351_14795 [Gemmatimonadales bacterium]|nr:MAG: hypothetical protein EA351_14795 [Gemmatimonadales bacterium]
MRNLSWVLAGLLILVVLPGCGGAGGGGGSVSWDGGIATASDAVEAPQKILLDNQYQMERTQGPPNIYLLTRWRSRSPLPAEAELGIAEVRTRFIVEARPRSRNPSGADLYTVRIRAENEGRMSGESDYAPVEITSDFREYAGRIANAIRDEIEMGTRVMD